MKILYSWLKEYIKFDLSPDELAERLTMAGLEAVTKEGEDSILELEITANRGDCLSMIGIAREVSVLTSNPLLLPKIYLEESDEKISDLINIIVMEGLCPRYTAKIIRDVNVRESPEGLRRRLLACGIRPVNNVVDVVNYVLLELGQPMHPFDYHSLVGSQLYIRLAREGERITTLDGITRKLDKRILVIADESHPVAIAGIMGSKDTQVTSQTRDVLLEAAYFDPSLINRMSRAINLTTESSYRFERGVDPEILPLAQDRAASLIKEIAGGRIVSGMIDIYQEKIKRVVITLNQAFLNKVLGTSLKEEEIISILKRLGLSLQTINSKSQILVEVPSYRHDLTRDIDLVEEIARVYGYEKIDPTLPHKTILACRRRVDEISNRIREILTGLGLNEIITYSFIDQSTLKGLRLDSDKIKVANPISEETSIMRPSLIPGMVKTSLWNMNRGMKDIKIFELGHIFLPSQEELPEERYHLACGMSGHYQEPSWRRKDEEIGFYELAAVLEGLFDELGIQYELVEARHPSLCEGRTAKIEVEGIHIGIIGEINPDVSKSFNLSTTLYLFELDLDKTIAFANLNKAYRPLSKYPPVIRDLAIIVKEEVRSRDIIEIIKEVGGQLIERIRLFDIYPGKRIGKEYEGSKSLAYSIVYRDHTSTLSDEFVNKIHHRIVSTLEQRLNARLRDGRRE